MRDSLEFRALLPPVSSVDELLHRLDELARDSIKSLPRGEIVVSYSGGIDSAILATLVAEEVGANTSLITVGVKQSRDVENQRRDRSSLPYAKLQHKVVEVGQSRIEEAALEVANMVNVSTVSHLEDCLAFYLIAESLANLGQKGVLIVSANGPDELFCGYDKFRRILDSEGYEAVNQESSRALQSAEMLQAEVRKAVGAFGFQSGAPFLEEKFSKFCLEEVPAELKIIKGDDRLRKRLWRVYGGMIGLPREIVLKPKQAMQYSMGIHKIVLKMLDKDASLKRWPNVKRARTSLAETKR